MAVPQVSVVICHHVGVFINDCLAALAKTEGVSYEVVVVSSCNPRTLPHWPGVRVLWSTDGPAAKRNLAIPFTSAPYLVFLDDDAEVEPDTLQALVAYADAHPTVGAQFCHLVNAERPTETDDGGSWLTPTGFLWARTASGNDGPLSERPVDCLAGKSAVCLFRRDAFRDAGGFDPAYYILGEETDLAWRLWLRGWRVVWNPQAKGRHWFNTSRKLTDVHYTLERIHRRGAANYVSLLWTNLGTPRLLCTLPPHLSAWVVAALGFALRGQPHRALQIMLGLCDALRRLPNLCRTRARTQARRLRSDRELWPSITHTPPWAYYPRRLLRYWQQLLHG